MSSPVRALRDGPRTFNDEAVEWDSNLISDNRRTNNGDSAFERESLAGNTFKIVLGSQMAGRKWGSGDENSVSAKIRNKRTRTEINSKSY
jgi:hypothetical protein